MWLQYCCINVAEVYGINLTDFTEMNLIDWITWEYKYASDLVVLVKYDMIYGSYDGYLLPRSD